MYNSAEKVVKNKIRLHPLLEKCSVENKDGILHYNLSTEEDDIVMNQLFSTYKGKTIQKIRIKKCILLSVDTEKYNKRRGETVRILNQYNLPTLSTFLGYTANTVQNSKFYNCMRNNKKRSELTCGTLEIFEEFVNTSNGNEWLLHFEDDVRPVNLDKNENLNFLYNIPHNADLIRPYIGKNTKSKLNNVKYKESYGGGLNHAFYISTNGCKKVIQYAKKYGWQFSADIDLYKISKFYPENPSGYDGWSLKSSNGLCDAVKVDSEDEKLYIYHMDTIFFNQTSLPCAPFY